MSKKITSMAGGTKTQGGMLSSMKPITETQFKPEFLSSEKYWWNRNTPAELKKPHQPHFQELLSIAQHHKEEFGLISTVVPTMHGWCPLDKACALYALVVARRPKVVVEIGTYAGRSFLPICWGLRKNAYGKAIGIDAYDAKVSSADELPGNQEWWGNLDHKKVEADFRFFLKRFNMGPITEIIVSPSDAVNPMESDILHIDGSHVEPAFRDAERFGGKVPVGGIVVMDDIQWTLGCVMRAIDKLEEMGFEEVFRSENGAWNILQRKELK